MICEDKGNDNGEMLQEENRHGFWRQIKEAGKRTKPVFGDCWFKKKIKLSYFQVNVLLLFYTENTSSVFKTAQEPSDVFAQQLAKLQC